MKHRYIVRTFVEASSPSEALKLAKNKAPHEVFIDDRVWEKEGYPLTKEDSRRMGIETK